MALTKSKVKIPKVVSYAMKKLRPKPQAWPDFSGKLPYSPNPKRKTFITAPYELPEKPDLNLRTPTDKLRPEFKLTGEKTMPKSEDRYEQPEWLTKILDKSDMKPKEKISFRQSVENWMGSMSKKGKAATGMKPRKPMHTGQVNQDRLIEQIKER